MGDRLTSESWLSKSGASQQCARGTQNLRTIHSNHFIQTQRVRRFYVRTRGCSKNDKANTQNTIKNNTAETNPASPLEATARPAPPREPGEPGQGTFTQEPAWPGPPREVGSWAETSATWRRLLGTRTWAGAALDRQGLEKQMSSPRRRSQPLKKPSAGAPRVQGDLARGPVKSSTGGTLCTCSSPSSSWPHPSQIRTLGTSPGAEGAMCLLIRTNQCTS